jgi:hypothetical protein
MPISLEDFLRSQPDSVPIRATVEPASKADRIIITPWQSNAGCSCRAALELPKEAIAGVIPTNETHMCCGKLLRVVELQFTPSGAVLADVLSQLMTREISMRAASADQDDCEVTCSEAAAECIANCGSPGCKAGCIRDFRHCIKRCR